MFARIRRHATFANTCSLLALTMALGMGTAYAADTVRSKDIVNGQVKNVDLGVNAVTSAKIKDGEVRLGDVAAGAVDSSRIVDSSIASIDLGSGSVGTSEIQTDAVGATEITDNSIDSGEIIADSLLASDLAAGSVGASEIADGTVTGTDIATGTISGTDVASESISTADLVGADVSGSISLSPGSIPVGQCKFFDITVGGAVADQAIVISARATLPTGQLLYGVEVPSAGHAIMAACNHSGSSWDGLTNFPIRVVTFG